MRKKMLFIYNPHAGKGKIRHLLSNIIELFVKNGYEVVTYATLGEKDAKRIVLDCLNREKYDIVVCSGGDGTLNEVIDGIMSGNKKIKIGYIPAGTTNDFAYSLGLPKNMPKSAQVVVNGQSFLCDVGNLNGEYFAYTAAFGIFTDASYATPQTSKNMLGRLAYILEGIKRLPNWKSYHIKITCKNRVIQDNFIYGMVANSDSIGGFKGITGKDVLLDDGLFEGVFIKVPQNVLDLQSIINDLLRGNVKSNHIFYLPVQEIQITSEEPVPWTIDGEYGGEFKSVHIKNLKQAISIIRNNPTKA
ncbi:diacylglycerol kinase family lipid kinase [Mobilitalea sibirica]|uniref:Diacylglycerol kinase family lipid kinase n=1 Tax=Mobilitalea sibirica TaxID=1462919 RepID=A0A8J7HC63_9FIRM|nr:diacylglycerol kinase family protein [Mobilitalea sibirica]MBH1940687.1 diacylglycerol kinase family lipid kinase [Mobilitalea sibirica]